MIHVKFSCILFVWTLLLLLGVVDRPTTNADAPPFAAVFTLPYPLPSWPRPPGSDFATGVIDIGGLQIRQVTSFEKIGDTNTGSAAAFYQPSPIPDGFSILGSYAQPSNQPLFGWVLVGKTDASDSSGPILIPPIDYTLVANTPENTAFFWLPTPPNGFAPVGLVATTSPEKPSLDNIRCVRSDFTDEAETDSWIWGDGYGLNIYGLRPKSRGSKAPGLSVGSFIVQRGDDASVSVSCLKNKNPSGTSNPNLSQIQELFKAYSPYIYFHPDENYLPSSVNWFFDNGALMYKQGDESNPVRIEPDGSNLPQGGSADGTYWLGLPVDDQARENVKNGDVKLSGPVYLHVKPVLGSTFTDIQVWIFYPFNGHAVLKLGAINRISLGQIGEHVGDWEHVTLRISNFDGVLRRVYFAQHGGGKWVDSPWLEFRDGNKVTVYASLNGHASYSQAGLVLQGDKDGVGIRNDAAKGNKVMDTGLNCTVVAAEGVVGPPWLDYGREWGPKISYDVWEEVKKIEKVLIWPLRKKLRNFIESLPPEVLGQEGPTGPKMKNNWDGDEV